MWVGGYEGGMAMKVSNRGHVIQQTEINCNGTNNGCTNETGLLFTHVQLCTEQTQRKAKHVVGRLKLY